MAPNPPWQLILSRLLLLNRKEIPICPTPDRPGTCNVYSELRFPDTIYNNIEVFREEQVQADS